VEKKEMSLWWRIIWRIGDFLIFHGIRDRLGMTRARLCNTGAFVLAPESFAFLTGLGIGLRQGYGATEGGVVTAHTLDDIRPDTCGAILPGVEVKITEDGEVIWRSELIFEGYHKNPEATAKAVRDGWYYSGDAGFINEDNHLVFLDRVSEMKKIRGGQSYAPQYIESRFRFSHYIKDAITLGDENKDFVTAIINMEYENVGRWAEKRSIPYTTFTDLSQRPEVGELIGRQVDRVNQQLPPEMRIKRYVLLYKEFDADEAELTRSRKLKRGVVEEKYATLIEAMYSDQKICSVESEFTYEDGRKGKISADVNIYEAEAGGD
jgi:long-chain acyl-CoA synthetase